MYKEGINCTQGLLFFADDETEFKTFLFIKLSRRINNRKERKVNLFGNFSSMALILMHCSCMPVMMYMRAASSNGSSGRSARRVCRLRGLLQKPPQQVRVNEPCTHRIRISFEPALCDEQDKQLMIKYAVIAALAR